MLHPSARMTKMKKVYRTPLPRKWKWITAKTRSKRDILVLLPKNRGVTRSLVTLKRRSIGSMPKDTRMFVASKLQKSASGSKVDLSPETKLFKF